MIVLPTSNLIPTTVFYWPTVSMLINILLNKLHSVYSVIIHWFLMIDLPTSENKNIPQTKWNKNSKVGSCLTWLTIPKVFYQQLQYFIDYLF